MMGIIDGWEVKQETSDAGYIQKDISEDVVITRDYAQDNNNIQLKKGEVYKSVLYQGCYLITNNDGKVILSTNQHIINTFFKPINTFFKPINK